METAIANRLSKMGFGRLSSGPASQAYGRLGRAHPPDAPTFFWTPVIAPWGRFLLAVAWFEAVRADWWASESMGDPFGVRQMNRLQLLSHDKLELCFWPHGSLTWQGRLRWTAGRA